MSVVKKVGWVVIDRILLVPHRNENGKVLEHNVTSRISVREDEEFVVITRR